MGWSLAIHGWTPGAILAVIAVALSALAIWHRITALGIEVRMAERRLVDSLDLAEVAERLAGFGSWSVNAQGEQAWSQGLCRLVGLPKGLLLDDALRCEMLPDRGAAFERALEVNARAHEPYEFEMEIDRVDGERRVLRIVGQNEFDRSGRLAGRHGVAIDVTEAVRQVEVLARDRAEALAAADEARRLAETDALTGLANRRRAMAAIDRAALAAAQDKVPLALIVFDIDHFKDVNDRYGHAVGDAVLSKVGDIARRWVRPGDLVARIGGEEFVCVMPGADHAVARARGEDLRQAIAKGTGTGATPAVTVSLGYAGWRKGDSALALFARADTALYAAKRAGRDCIRRVA